MTQNRHRYYYYYIVKPEFRYNVLARHILIYHKYKHKKLENPIIYKYVYVELRKLYLTERRKTVTCTCFTYLTSIYEDI